MLEVPVKEFIELSRSNNWVVETNDENFNLLKEYVPDTFLPGSKEFINSNYMNLFVSGNVIHGASNTHDKNRVLLKEIKPLVFDEETGWGF